MSFSYREGKDEVHFITEEDLKEYAAPPKEEEVSAKSAESAPSAESVPSGAVSDEVHEQYPGAVSENGDINWDCPCLGGLGTEGPCVEEFRSAFSCWMFSDAEKEGGERGDNCVDNFFAMSSCMQQNEEFYDELNAKNKAAAEEAYAKYEEEELVKLAAIDDEMKALEESESETPAVLPAVMESETETKVETESETQIESLPVSNPSPAALYVSSEPEFPKSDFSSNNSIIVAATLEEQETEPEEENVVEENTEDQDVEKS